MVHKFESSNVYSYQQIVWKMVDVLWYNNSWDLTAHRRTRFVLQLKTDSLRCILVQLVFCSLAVYKPSVKLKLDMGRSAQMAKWNGKLLLFVSVEMFYY